MRILRHPEYPWIIAILLQPWSADSGRQMVTLRCERCFLNQTILIRAVVPIRSWLILGFTGAEFAEEHRFCEAR